MVHTDLSFVISGRNRMNRGNFYVVWVCTLLIVTGKGEVEVSECVWERERRDIDVQMYGKIEKQSYVFLSCI